MSGLIKQKSVALQDSNIANLGSKENIEARRKAAALEPEWKIAGKEVGIEVWRIEKLKVVKWPKSQYGSFYSGDSYLILRTYKKDSKSDALRFNLHFWLGRDSTQDEKGVAAYKAVELDDFLGGVPCQFREVQDHESKEFLECFGGRVTYLEGGIESGFEHVKPEEYKARLMHVKGRTEMSVVVKEVPVSKDSMNEGDVFVLDLGLTLIQWNGRSANVMEKRKGADFTKDLCAARLGKSKIRVIESQDPDEEFWTALGGQGPIADAIPDEEVKKKAEEEKKFVKLLFRLSDASGSMEFTQVGQAVIKTTDFKTEDVFIMDVGSAVYSWIGNGTTADERSSAIKTALEYLVKNNRPTYIPVLRVLEGQETESFYRWCDDCVNESGVLRIPKRTSISAPATETKTESKVIASSSSAVTTTTATSTTTTTAAAPKRFCSTCGKPVKKPGQDKFCRQCGIKL